MTVRIESLAPDTLEIRIEGMLRKADYEAFVPAAERRIDEHGRVNLLIHLNDLAGVSPPALWEDIKFDARHYDDIGRIALVGPEDSGMQSWLSTLAKPFTTGEIKHYSEREIESAREWVCAMRSSRLAWFLLRNRKSPGVSIVPLSGVRHSRPVSSRGRAFLIDTA